MNITPARKIAKARASLTFTNPFFGFILLNMKPVETRQFPTFATDGVHLFYNPDLTMKISMAQLRAELAHEALHPAFLHNFRRGNRNPRMWNRAGDFCINPILLEAGFVLGKDWLLDPKYKGMTADRVYGLLRKEQEQSRQNRRGTEGKGGSGKNKTDSKTNKSDTGPSQPQGTSGGDSAVPTDLGSEASADLDSGELPGHSPDCGCGGILDFPGKEGEKPTSAGMAKAESEMQVTIAQAVAFAKAQGKMPAGLYRNVKKFVEPTDNPWDQLRRFVEQAARNDFNWMRPNRRYVSYGIYLPSIISQELGEMVVAIDTSGSIDQDQLNRFAGHLTAILHAIKVEKVHVVYCDAKVANTEEFSSDDIPLTLQAKGGGGTSFIPPFEWVEEQGIQPACLIYMTDLICTSYPEEPGYPVMWAVNHPRAERFTVPFGEKICIN